MARGKTLPLAYFYPSVALNGGMCNEDMKSLAYCTLLNL